MRKYVKTICNCLKVFGYSLFTIFILIGCKDNSVGESVLIQSTENISNIELIDNIKNEDENNQIEVREPVLNETLVGYEGEWYRTNVATYEWARITIRNWIEGESFDVVLLANYADYGGPIEGTAIFISENTAVVYDENLMNAFQGQVDDYGVYLQFKDDSIVVTHSEEVKPCFGGDGIVTAEGTYIQGKPNYTNVTDVSTIFTEDKLKEIQKLLGDKYETMFEWVIEMGETEEYSLTEGTLWKAYYPPYGAVWCNILIYNNGSIYIEGSYWEKGYWFYSNTDATEMPTIE